MAKYTTRPKRPRAEWDDDDSPLLPALTVYDDSGATETGVLSKDGAMIYRVKEFGPIGFKGNG